MDVYILDDHLTITTIIDQWESFIWTRKFREADSFELTLNINDEKIINKLKTQHYIARSDSIYSPDAYMIGYISSIRDQNDGESRTVIVSGYGAEGIFRKRLFPFWLSFSELKKLNFNSLLKSIHSFGCRMRFDTNIFDPDILNVPTNYMEGNMEDYIRYLMTSGELQFTYHVLLRYIPDEEDMDNENSQVHPCLYFLVEKEDNILRPNNILSESTDNFTNVQYSFSEDGTYSKIYVKVNPDFNVSVTEMTDEKDEDGEYITKTYNIGYSDVEDVSLPEYVLDLTQDINNYNVINSSYLSVNEHLIFVDPVIKKGQKRFDGVSRWIKSDVPIGNCTISSNGTQYLVTPSEMVGTWYIDKEETLKAMKKAAEDVALIGTENFTGRMVISEISSRNSVVLGEIVVVRDNKRNRDYYKRVEEIEEVWDNNGHSYQPTLGESLKTIYDLIESK